MGTILSVLIPQIHRILTALIQTHGSGQYKRMNNTNTREALSYGLVRSTESYILPFVKQVASGNLLYEAGNPNLVLCDNLEEWDGEGVLYCTSCEEYCL